VKKELNNNLPDYLKDLATPTAIGREKLIALWDGLTLEDQINLLTLIKVDYEHPKYETFYSFDNAESPPGELPNSYLLNHKLFLKALGSKSDFIRSLAAYELYSDYEIPDGEDIKINDLIDNDKSDLVKYTKYLKPLLFTKDFFELPLEARLIIVSLKRMLNFFRFNEVIQQAIDDGLFKSEKNETELNQVLWELINNSALWKEHSSEMVNTNLLIGKSELWDLIPSLPLSSGSILVEKLPIDDGRISEGIFNLLTRRQQGLLFEREDFVMSDIRREFYFKDADENDDNFWITAPSYHLSFSDEEFSEILQKPEEERKNRLYWLTYAKDVSLHHHLLLRFLVNYDDEEDYWKRLRQNHAELIKTNLVDYYKELMDQGTLEVSEEYLYKYRLLSLAKSSSHWDKESFDTALHFRNKFFNIRVEKDIWATYLAFYNDLMYDIVSYGDLPIGAFENDAGLPIELTDKETIETTLDSINKKIDKKTNELEGRFDLINKNFGWALFFIIILLIYIAK